MSLRPYQIAGLDEIRGHFGRGKKRVLLVMPTGAGKTVVFCEIVKKAIEKGKKCIIVVRGRKLVDQASQRLFREQVPHGVLMAKHWNFRPHLSVQVCSIDTLISRGLVPDADIVIIDEGHLFAPESQASKHLEHYNGKFWVPVTATPYVDGGLRHLADEMVRPISMQELVDQGFLVPFRYFAPSEPNLDGVAIDSKTHDYKTAPLAERMISGQLTGRIIDHWKKFGENRQTLLFAVNINHSKFLVEKFLEAGIKAEHCDADSSDREREAVIRRLVNGETQIVCNVGIFCTGIDIPSLSCLISARPTKSYNLFIQQAGRGTRISDGKRDCILLDHSGNIRRHGFPTLEPAVDLDGNVRVETVRAEGKICKVCFCVYKGKECPECGATPETRERRAQIVESDEELHEIEVKAKTPVEQWLEYLEQQRTKTNRKQGWQYWKLLEKFKYEECKHLLPKWFIYRYESKQQDHPFADAPFSSGGWHQ